MMRAFEVVTSQPWLITNEALEMIVAISERANDLDALAAKAGRPLANARRVTMRDGTAIIPITGPIMRYANLFTEISGATSTEMLARDLRAAMDDPLVHDIVLNIDSPGGMAAGINELGDMVFEARKEKRIIAYAGGQMQSAAYWIGSAADEIVIDRTGIAGSIGALMSITDTSQRDQRAGVRTIEIVSSQSPDKRVDPNMDEGRAKLQKIVDDLAGVFVASVARNRGIDAETVLSNFGKGGSMVGQAAVDAGMADRLGSLESLLTSLAAEREPNRRIFSMATKKGPIVVANTDALRSALAAGHTADEITIESMDIEKLKADAHAAGILVGHAEQAVTAKAELDAAVVAAVAGERARIVGLGAISMKGFEKEVQAAVESGATVEATAVAITKLARDRGTTVASQQAAATQAVGHGGAQPETTTGNGWGKISAKFKQKVKTR